MITLTRSEPAKNMHRFRTWAINQPISCDLSNAIKTIGLWKAQGMFTQMPPASGRRRFRFSALRPLLTTCLSRA